MWYCNALMRLRRSTGRLEDVTEDGPPAKKPTEEKTGGK